MYSRSPGGTPVFVGRSDREAHVPLARVRETTAMLSDLDSNVTELIHPGAAHTVNADEIAHVRRMIAAL